MNKVGILINNDIDDILNYKAKKMGTSKRNVISLALSDILDQDIKKEHLDHLKKRTTGLNHATTITVSEPFLKKIDRINKHGYSVRLFLGFLLCEHFYNSDGIEGYDVISQKDFEHQTNKKTEKDDLKPIIDKAAKLKIKNYCWEHALSVSSLYTHYILEKPITVKDYSVKEEAMLSLNFSLKVKRVIDHRVEEKSINNNIFFNLISAQICQDLSL